MHTMYLSTIYADEEEKTKKALIMSGKKMTSSSSLRKVMNVVFPRMTKENFLLLLSSHLHK